MNPSSSGYIWNNPPPPGTEFDSPEEDSNFSSQKNESTRSSERAIDRIDPYLKNPAYQGREGEYSSERTRYRSRSKSSERYNKRRRSSRSYSRRSRSHSRQCSRSRSRDRYRRSRSRSGRRRQKYSSSSSRSRSRSSSYRHRRRKFSRRYSRSRSRSGGKSHSRSRAYKSRSNSYSRSQSHRSDREKKHSRSPRVKKEREDSDHEKFVEGDLIGEEDMKLEEPECEPEQEPEYDQGPVPFKNDGSFLEMFKKLQELQKVKEEPPEQLEPKKPILPAFGKRRGGKVLKTGMVAKVRNVEEDSNNAQDAWSVYMKEVRRYKEVHCDDDSKTRPLVK